MKNRILVFFISLLGSTFALKGQHKTPEIVLNHFLIVVDSITYQEILKSKILKSDFAYAHEKKLTGHSGIYIIGQDNYIEIFNPKSIQNEVIKPGESWICHTSMKVNHLEGLEVSNDMLNFSTNEEFDELSLYFRDSTNLFTTWEMNKNHYENWSKKTFSDSVNFLSVDYNSLEESDSSKTYLFNNILGIKVIVDEADSPGLTEYMTLIGYSKSITNENRVRFSNSVDFVDVDFQKGVEIPTVTTVYMKLKNETKTERIETGNSVLQVEGNKAVWQFSPAK